MITMPFSVRRADASDVPALVAVFEAAFRTDRHTRVKALDGGPQVLSGGMSAALLSWLEASTRCSVLTAVDDATGEILGWACWSHHGYGDAVAPTPAQQIDDEPAADEPVAGTPQLASLEALEALTDRDRERWQEILMPEGTRCRTLVAIAVSPEHQSRGVGSALIRWGTRRADLDGVFCWVHASEAGSVVFEKQGFAEVGRLEVDLDEYAPEPPGNDDASGRWGTYTFRYMKRLPVS